MDDDDIIEGQVTSVTIHQEKPKIRFQATIKAQTDHKLNQVANVVFDAEKFDKDTVWSLLVEYFQARVNLLHVKMIFKEYMLGAKPKITRNNASKFTIEFTKRDGSFIENYTVQVIEI